MRTTSVSIRTSAAAEFKRSLTEFGVNESTCDTQTTKFSTIIPKILQQNNVKNKIIETWYEYIYFLATKYIKNKKKSGLKKVVKIIKLKWNNDSCKYLKVSKTLI